MRASFSLVFPFRPRSRGENQRSGRAELIQRCTQSYQGWPYRDRIRYTEEVSAIAEPELPATFTFAEAEDRGLSRRRLQHLQATGAGERIGRGLYRRTDEEPADHDLIEIAARAHQPTLCLLSALARHELTDIIPPVHDIAIPRGM